MSGKMRSINTKFWDDPYIEELPKDLKLMYLYFITNPFTNLLGVYELTEKKIINHTGLDKETIRNGFERFGKDNKAYFKDNFLILPNFLKNQKLNANMKKAVLNEFSELPNWLKTIILGNGSESLNNHSKPFQNLLKCLGEIEIEREIERESECENVSRSPMFDDPIEAFKFNCHEANKSVGAPQKVLENFINHWTGIDQGTKDYMFKKPEQGFNIESRLRNWWEREKKNSNDNKETPTISSTSLKARVYNR